MKDSGFKPKSDIQDYLFEKFNLDLYDDISKNKSDDPFFDPLSFFNLLYECLEFVKANKNKPIDVANHLEHRFFQKTISQKEYDAHLFLLLRLADLIRLHSGYSEDFQTSIYSNDDELKTCRTFLNRLHYRLMWDNYPFEREFEVLTCANPEEIWIEYEWNFDRHREIMNDIKDPEEKIKYLLSKKAEFLTGPGAKTQNFEFPDYCDILIAQLKEIIAIKTSRKRQQIDKNITLKDIFRDKGEHDKIMKLLVNSNYCHEDNYLWKDRKKGYKGVAVALIKYLDARKYFIENISLTNEAIIYIIKNTFGLSVGIDIAKTNQWDSFDWEKELITKSKH